MARSTLPRLVLLGWLATTVAVAGACSNTKSSSAKSAASPDLAPAGSSGGTSAAAGTSNGPSASPGGLGAQVGPAQPQIVRTGDVHLTVGAGLMQKSFDQVAGLVTAAGGFVSDSDMSTGRVPSARLVLRVANARVTSVVNQLAGIGRITAQTLQGQDVTGQVIDLTARVSVLQSEEGAVRTLLSRASAIGDILQIQSQLFTLQTQIEQMDGQRSALADQTTWATVSVEIAELAPGAQPPASPQHRPSTAVRAWRLARDNTVAVTRGLALGVGWAAPAVLVTLVFSLPFYVRRRNRARAA
jgi:hypothetical protein